jgi:hypothetical protein
MPAFRHLGLFPFCVEGTAPLTLAQAMAAFWRVKRWTISACTLSVTTKPAGDLTPPEGIDTELDLICLTGGASPHTLEYDPDGGGTT